MITPNFAAMSKKELIAYILEHRDEDQPFYILMDKIKDAPGEVYPAPQSIDDLKHFPEILAKHRQEKEQNKS